MKISKELLKKVNDIISDRNPENWKLYVEDVSTINIRITQNNFLEADDIKTKKCNHRFYKKETRCYYHLTIQQTNHTNNGEEMPFIEYKITEKQYNTLNNLLNPPPTPETPITPRIITNPIMGLDI